jgi:hypothetical protein
MEQMTNLWSLDQNKGLKFQKKIPQQFSYYCWDPNPIRWGLGGWVSSVGKKTILEKWAGQGLLFFKKI